MKFKTASFSAILSVVLLMACNNNKEQPADTAQKNSTDKKKDTVQKTVAKTIPVKPPVINILDSVSVKRTVICMKDSAASMERIGAKLAAICGKVNRIIKENKLNNTGMPMAWYTTSKAPYFFEAGIPVDKKPTKLPPGTFLKQTGTDSVIIAHFFGPYNLIPQGYNAVKEFMADHKKKSIAPPYEIYIGDPAVQKDPYKIQTDIVFPVK
ncbi:MAG: hypothetical protein ABJA78_11760 [Ferruginibacter sp.]